MSELTDDTVLSLEEFCALVKQPDVKMTFADDNKVGEGMFKEFIRLRGEKLKEEMRKTDPDRASRYDDIHRDMPLQEWKKLLVIWKFNWGNGQALQDSGTINVKRG